VGGGGGVGFGLGFGPQAIADTGSAKSAAKIKITTNVLVWCCIFSSSFFWTTPA
jgi:hypothetical protein